MRQPHKSLYHGDSILRVCSEDGMDVYPTSQWMDLTQVSIANCLGVKNNR